MNFPRRRYTKSAVHKFLIREFNVFFLEFNLKKKPTRNNFKLIVSDITLHAGMPCV